MNISKTGYIVIFVVIVFVVTVIFAEIQQMKDLSSGDSEKIEKVCSKYLYSRVNETPVICLKYFKEDSSKSNY